MMYSDYLKEIGIAECLEDEKGFMIYSKINGDEVFIRDLYVRPEFRKKHVATSYVDAVLPECKSQGYKFLRCSVNLSMKPEAVATLLLGYAKYGFKISDQDSEMIWLFKEIQ